MVVRIRTPSGGAHIYFKYDPRLLNWGSKIAPGIDIRTTGGLLVAPGTWKDGKRYESLGEPLGSVEFPPFPEKLIPAVKERREVEPVEDAAPNQVAWAESTLEFYAEELADNRAEINDLKANLSRSSDKARAAYAHNSIEVPRQCIFIGTTNDREYLRDPNQAHGLDIKALGGATFLIYMSGFVGEMVGGAIADAWKSRGGSPNVIMRTLFGFAACIRLRDGTGVASVPSSVPSRRETAWDGMRRS